MSAYNNEIKIKDLKEEKQKLEKGITGFLTDNIIPFCKKFGITDIEINLDKAYEIAYGIVSIKCKLDIKI